MAVRKRIVQQPSVIAVDSEDDQEDSDGINEFNASPVYKKKQPIEPMMITRSQRTKKGRKRTATQAGLSDAVTNALDLVNTASEAVLCGRERRSTRKRRLN